MFLNIHIKIHNIKKYYIKKEIPKRIIMIEKDEIIVYGNINIF